MNFEAHAKVNLSLDVLGKRPDGYHELRTVMAIVALADTLRARPARDVAVTASQTLPADNTVVRAITLYKEQYKTDGAHMYIEKRIPSMAGLGGASADAAAALVAMQTFYHAAAQDELFDLALRVGADVPFCLQGGVALCQGVGERMTTLPQVHCPIVLLKGTGGVSTAALFGALRLPLAQADTDAVVAAIQQNDIPTLAARMGNALLTPAEKICGEIGQNLQMLREAGALGVNMSGSGACVYGIFESKAAAKAALARLSGAAFACVSEL